MNTSNSSYPFNNSAPYPLSSSFFGNFQNNQELVPYNQNQTLHSSQPIIPYYPSAPKIQNASLEYVWMILTSGNKETKLLALKSLMSEQASNQATVDQMKACLEKVELARQKIKTAEEYLERIQNEKNDAKIICITKSNESCTQLLKVIQSITSLTHSQHNAMPFDQILQKEKPGTEYFPFLEKVNQLETALPEFLNTANETQLDWAIDSTYKLINQLFAKKLENISNNILDIAKQNQYSRETIQQFKSASQLRKSCHQVLQQNLSLLYADLGKIFNTTPVQSPDDRPLYNRLWSNRSDIPEILVIDKKKALEAYELSEKEAQEALNALSEKEAEEIRANHQLCIEKKEAENAVHEQWVYFQTLGLSIPDNNSEALLLN
jgi:hypothetical protein